MIEYYFMCPYCGAEISMLLDPSVQKQDYVEDCEVCCNPIRVRCEIAEGEVEVFDAISIEQ